MVRFMADAIDCSQFTATVNVPGRGSQPVVLRAGYINGRWPTASQCGTEVSIDVNGSAPQADVLDIETGDATPDAAPAWVRAHNARGGFPAVLYCNRSMIHAVANACDAAGLQVGRDFRWWIATLDGTETVPDMTGVVAVQVWGANYFGGLNIDLSIVYDDSWKGTDDMPSADEVAAAVWNYSLAQRSGYGPGRAADWVQDTRINIGDTTNRVFGMLQQRYYRRNDDGTLTPVDPGTDGAVPAGVLDTLDGNFLVQQVAGLNAALQAVTAALAKANGADPALLKQAVEDGMNAALANIHVVTGP